MSMEVGSLCSWKLSTYMVGHLFQNYDTMYVRFFPTYTCNHSYYTIYVLSCFVGFLFASIIMIIFLQTLIYMRTKKPIYSFFEKDCLKKCTHQSRKVLWVVLSSLFFKEIWKNGTRGHWSVFASFKVKQQK